MWGTIEGRDFSLISWITFNGQKKSTSVHCKSSCNLRAFQERGGWLWIYRVKSHDMNTQWEAPPVCTMYLKD